MSRTERERVQQARAAGHETRRYLHRRRFGRIGTEPPQGRSAFRHYGSMCVGIVALLVSLASVEAGAALTVVSLAIGVPRSWTWAGDKLSSLSWIVAVVMLVVGEVLFLVGDEAIRRTSTGGHSPGAASILVAFSNAVANLGFYRRWGGGGDSIYWLRQFRKGDPEAIAYGEKLQKASGRHYDDKDD